MVYKGAAQSCVRFTAYDMTAGLFAHHNKVFKMGTKRWLDWQFYFLYILIFFMTHYLSFFEQKENK